MYKGGYKHSTQLGLERAHTSTHTHAGDTHTVRPFSILAGDRGGCPDGCGGPGAERKRRLKAARAETRAKEWAWEGSARPGWHLNPPHVVDLMDGCRSPFRGTGDELGRGPRAPTSFTFQPRGHSPPPRREPPLTTMK